MTPQEISALEKIFRDVAREILEKELRALIPGIVREYMVEREAWAYLRNQRIKILQGLSSITE